MWKIRFVLLVVLAAGLGVVAGRPAQAQGQNLLTNPSFEGAYSAYIPNPPHPDCLSGTCGTAQVPAGWTPWWASRPADEPDLTINKMPEYKPAEGFANRIHGGATAAQYFTHWGSHTAGLRQTVTVPANARLRFTAWGQVWSSHDDGGTSIEPAPYTLMVGIDPTGGGDPWSPAIVWGAAGAPYDYYAQFTVDAQAQGSTVTVFTYSRADEPKKHNDVYWDDASLVVIGGFSAPVSSGNNSAASGPAVNAPAVQTAPTSTPNAEGLIQVVVQSGDSLWSIAANAGLTLDELLALNDMERDHVVKVGDLVIVGRAEPSGEVGAGETVTATAEISGTAEAEVTSTPAATVEPTATVGPPTSTPEPLSLAQPDDPGGSICLKAFDDANSNGLHDNGEGLREAVAFTIANETLVVSNYVTDGVSEPYCIRGLTAGSYQITRSALEVETLTTPGDWAISLTEGGLVNIEFGSHLDENSQVAAATAPAQSQPDDASNALTADNDDGGGGSRITTYIIIAVAVAVLLLVGVLVVILSSRRPAH